MSTLRLTWNGTLELLLDATRIYVNPMAEGWDAWEHPGDALLLLEKEPLSERGVDELHAGAEGALQKSTAVFASQAVVNYLRARPPLRSDMGSQAPLRDRIRLVTDHPFPFELNGLTLEFVTLNAGAPYAAGRVGMLVTKANWRMLVVDGSLARGACQGPLQAVDLLAVTPGDAAPEDVARLLRWSRATTLYWPMSRRASQALTMAIGAERTAGGATALYLGRTLKLRDLW